MTRSSASRRVFRSSVVSVTAAFAPLVGGCTTTSTIVSNPPACFDASTGCIPYAESESDAGEECPVTRPASGSQCESVPSSGCVYGQELAFCEDGTWRLAPARFDGGVAEGGAGEGGTSDERCPEAPPWNGSACSVPVSLRCDYDPCYGAPTKMARCQGGTWSLQHTSCNPPFMACPSEQPVAESACDTSWGASACSYGTCDTGDAAVTLVCIANKWTTTSECPSACPGAAPTTGSACWHVGDPCRYGDCYGVPTISADCREGKWQIAEATCNPPPPEL